ncbi:uncharacterized protein CcaverHIS019_0200310 [Cutaneotrichosporon cavernicola]|uniref:Glycosyltransferase family 18 catalytic domain-containing protein n=1 Tax=Cutaneotrichosporon cavernicola TaxID=279322 RepID=A0AA48KXU7_9TREE|nr:uncharacterized protein CcaverHIS019_0200310 [Cutaneotrichosporon cavernicola]BEI88669.1 hypothetical protein CcaverHIS019_0200310 [Cutaneotrichosporon cavernicola]
MHGLPPQSRPTVWRMVVPAIIFVIASTQFAVLLASYYDVGLPVRLDVSWKPATKPQLPTHFTETQTQLTDIPTVFSDPNADNYRWYTDAKLRQLTGFTVLHGGDNDWRYIHHLHRQLGDMVRVIVADEGEERHKGTFDQYQKSASRPDGIPAWKWFRMAYYPTGESGIVGKAWMISAEPRLPQAEDLELVRSASTPDDYTYGPSWFVTGSEELQIKSAPGKADFTFLGYGIMPIPEDTVVVPWKDRPNRVYLLAKQAHYFHNGHQRVYDFSFFERAAEELSREFPGFEFVGGFEDNRSDEVKAKWGPVPSVIKNLGLMNATRFDEEYGKSRLLLGLGSPPLSPSPYRALARGVPFANPHTMREDGKGWAYQQHDSMMDVPEPYVYQVEAFNYTSFVHTIRKALQTPIEPLRFERMRQDAIDRRMHGWVMHDWRGLASQILDDRLAGNETQGSNSVRVFEL